MPPLKKYKQNILHSPSLSVTTKKVFMKFFSSHLSARWNSGRTVSRFCWRWRCCQTALLFCSNLISFSRRPNPPSKTRNRARSARTNSGSKSILRSLDFWSQIFGLSPRRRRALAGPESCSPPARARRRTRTCCWTACRRRPCRTQPAWVRIPGIKTPKLFLPLLNCRKIMARYWCIVWDAQWVSKWTYLCLLLRIRTRSSWWCKFTDANPFSA